MIGKLTWWLSAFVRHRRLPVTALKDLASGRIFGLLRRGIALPYYKELSIETVRHKRRSATTDPHIVVLQMGHVGSKTVSRTLINHDSQLAVFHGHWLSDWSVGTFYDAIDQQRIAGQRRTVHLNAGKLARLMHLRDRVKARKDRWKVVTLVREPIARAISAVVHRDWRTVYSALPDGSWEDKRRLISDKIGLLDKDVYSIPAT